MAATRRAIDDHDGGPTRSRRPATQRASRRRERPAAIVAVLVVALMAVGLASACASGSKTSFTSLDASDQQAIAWLEATVDRTFPNELERRRHSAGRQSCASAADFAEIDHEIVVTVAPQDVDR